MDLGFIAILLIAIITVGVTVIAAVTVWAWNMMIKVYVKQLEKMIKALGYGEDEE